MRIRQYGLPRSGSNYLRWLIEHNYKDEVLVATGKHQPPTATPEADLTVVSIKEPFAWLVSLYRHPASGGSAEDRTPEQFNEWVNRPLVTPAGGGSWGARWAFDHPIDAWNAMHTLWLASGAKPVRYEDLLDPEEAQRVFAGLELQRVPGHFKLPPAQIAPSQEYDEGKATEPRFSPGVYDRTWYTERRYMTLYTPESITAVANRVDGALAERLYGGAE